MGLSSLKATSPLKKTNVPYNNLKKRKDPMNTESVELQGNVYALETI